jgi:hypothetical protein
MYNNTDLNLADIVHTYIMDQYCTCAVYVMYKLRSFIYSIMYISKVLVLLPQYAMEYA